MIVRRVIIRTTLPVQLSRSPNVAALPNSKYQKDTCG